MPMQRETDTYEQTLYLGERESFSFDMRAWYGRRKYTSAGMTVTSDSPNLVITQVATDFSRQQVSWDAQASRPGRFAVEVKGIEEGGDTNLKYVIFDVQEAPRGSSNYLYR